MITSKDYICECDDESCELVLPKQVYEKAYEVYLSEDSKLMILHPDCKSISKYHFIARTRDYILVTMK